MAMGNSRSRRPDAATLPMIGFGAGGITAGSIAAGMQGPAVAAGSNFAALQSLGATGMGSLLLGVSGAVIGAFAPLAAEIGWAWS